MGRIYRPLTDEQKLFVRRNYGEMTAPQIAEKLSVELKRMINFVNNERKAGKAWTRKEREQKSYNNLKNMIFYLLTRIQDIN